MKVKKILLAVPAFLFTVTASSVYPAQGDSLSEEQYIFENAGRLEMTINHIKNENVVGESLLTCGKELRAIRGDTTNHDRVEVDDEIKCLR